MTIEVLGYDTERTVRMGLEGRSKGRWEGSMSSHINREFSSRLRPCFIHSLSVWWQGRLRPSSMGGAYCSGCSFSLVEHLLGRLFEFTATVHVADVLGCVRLAVAGRELGGALLLGCSVLVTLGAGSVLLGRCAISLVCTFAGSCTALYLAKTDVIIMNSESQNDLQ